MEASTNQVEPLKKKGFKPKQLVKSVSNKYGKNGTYWKKKKDRISNEEYCNGSKIKGSSRIKRYLSKLISKIKNSITELEVEPTTQKLETDLLEEGSIQSQ
ncbi:hypothetical protein O181_096372 [Austropuccinia psidii MF-1]|uniref:Uncharacterized protein n=1 Tax=Austropuccinia psidii MF-1 TaxID=1389203 RepID=A0A9Q3PDF3_9BASI|nr:hypothetical protein [Austropuccinia psidii MF-1]